MKNNIPRTLVFNFPKYSRKSNNVYSDAQTSNKHFTSRVFPPDLDMCNGLRIEHTVLLTIKYSIVYT